MKKQKYGLGLAGVMFALFLTACSNGVHVDSFPSVMQMVVAGEAKTLERLKDGKFTWKEMDRISPESAWFVPTEICPEKRYMVWTSKEEDIDAAVTVFFDGEGKPWDVQIRMPALTSKEELGLKLDVYTLPTKKEGYDFLVIEPKLEDDTQKVDHLWVTGFEGAAGTAGLLEYNKVKGEFGKPDGLPDPIDPIVVLAIKTSEEAFCREQLLRHPALVQIGRQIYAVSLEEEP